VDTDFVFHFIYLRKCHWEY